MFYKTILVSLNDLDRNSVLLESVARLARNHDAHLQGLYVIPAVEVHAGIGFEPVLFEERHNAYRKAAWSVRTHFTSILQRFSIRGDFAAIESASPDISAYVIDHARRSDITVIGQPSESSGLTSIDNRLIERVLLSTGRPTIVIPKKDEVRLNAEPAIVGWSGTREATRAAFDSIPLLISSKKVRVVWIDAERTRSYDRGTPEDDLTTALCRHGINATFEPISAGGAEAGQILLKTIKDTHAGLLVMGAYGHSRFSEMILGGATKAVLTGMTCPVLFSH